MTRTGTGASGIWGRGTSPGAASCTTPGDITPQSPSRTGGPRLQYLDSPNSIDDVTQHMSVAPPVAWPASKHCLHMALVFCQYEHATDTPVRGAVQVEPSETRNFNALVSRKRLAPSTTTLGVDLAGRLDHGVQPLAKLFMAQCSVQIELRSERFKNCAHADTLLSGEAMPVVVSIVAHVGMEGFPTIVIRH